MEGRTHETTKKWHFSDPPRAFQGDRPTVGLNSKNPLKKIFRIFVKLTSYTYACNNLTNLEYEAHAMTGNESESIEIGLEKFVKSHQVTLFLAGFSYLKPLCGRVVQ